MQSPPPSQTVVNGDSDSMDTARTRADGGQRGRRVRHDGADGHQLGRRPERRQVAAPPGVAGQRTADNNQSCIPGGWAGGWTGQGPSQGPAGRL